MQTCRGWKVIRGGAAPRITSARPFLFHRQIAPIKLNCPIIMLMMMTTTPHPRPGLSTRSGESRPNHARYDRIHSLLRRRLTFRGLLPNFSHISFLRFLFASIPRFPRRRVTRRRFGNRHDTRDMRDRGMPPLVIGTFEQRDTSRTFETEFPSYCSWDDSL